jgi:hypothetical protein
MACLLVRLWCLSSARGTFDAVGVRLRKRSWPIFMHGTAMLCGRYRL